MVQLHCPGSSSRLWLQLSNFGQSLRWRKLSELPAQGVPRGKILIDPPRLLGGNELHRRSRGKLNSFGSACIVGWKQLASSRDARNSPTGQIQSFDPWRFFRYSNG